MRILLVGFLFFCSLAFSANTYYVSKSIGADTNTSTQAKSKATPWQHLRGMNSCTSNCASYTPVAGDTFVLMGCDTWVASDLPLSWDWSGTLGNPINIAVDNTWFNTTSCPSTWNRPIFDAGGAVISAGLGNSFVWASANSNTSNVTIDNIEMRGLNGPAGGGHYLFAFNATNNWTMSNLYLHAWNAAVDNCILVQFQTGGNVFTNGVIDGSDSTGAAAGHSCTGFYPTLPDVLNTVIHDLPNGIVGYAGGGGGGNTVTLGGNLLYNITDSFQGANHCNTTEILGGGTYYIHDNVMHDIQCSGGEVMMLGNSGENSYIWNNILYNNSVGQSPNFPQTAGQTGIIGLHFWNNTIVANGGLSCIYFSGQGGGSIGTLDIRDNLCITTASDTWGGGITPTTLIDSSNVVLTPATATADGYTAGQTFAFSPTSAGSPTVGAGANLTSVWPGGFSTSDTGYGCTASAGVVTCPARTVLTRPGSGVWDAGAYQFSAAAAPGPAPAARMFARRVQW